MGRGEHIEERLMEFRRITSKGQVTIPNAMRKRYNITTQTRLEFVPEEEGILVKPAKDEGTFREMAGSASNRWKIAEMLKRLDELREENV